MAVSLETTQIWLLILIANLEKICNKLLSAHISNDFHPSPNMNTTDHGFNGQ
jgi:hypothetical protein